MRGKNGSNAQFAGDGADAHICQQEERGGSGVRTACVQHMHSQNQGAHGSVQNRCAVSDAKHCIQPSLPSFHTCPPLLPHERFHLHFIPFHTEAKYAMRGNGIHIQQTQPMRWHKYRKGSAARVRAARAAKRNNEMRVARFQRAFLLVKRRTPRARGVAMSPSFSSE